MMFCVDVSDRSVSCDGDVKFSHSESVSGKPCRSSLIDDMLVSPHITILGPDLTRKATKDPPRVDKEISLAKTTAL